MFTLSPDDILLFHDTETTGFPSAGKAARDPKQARVCQTAFILADAQGVTLAEVCFMVRPDGWVIGAGAAAVHGLSDAGCEKYGLSSLHAFQTFQELAARATIFVAHNAAFDWGMQEIEAQAHSLKMPVFKRKFCTMKDTGLPMKGKGLTAALLAFCNRARDEEAAHDAMADARDCRDVFFAWYGQRSEPAGLVVPPPAFDESLYADLV